MAKKRKPRHKKRRAQASQPVRQAQTEPRGEIDLSTEYRYVAEDLGRIGIIAAVLIALLVGLSFFL